MEFKKDMAGAGTQCRFKALGGEAGAGGHFAEQNEPWLFFGSSRRSPKPL
jgi:hypothetical protein